MTLKFTMQPGSPFEASAKPEAPAISQFRDEKRRDSMERVIAPSPNTYADLSETLKALWIR